jgi:hypothetical protein
VFAERYGLKFQTLFRRKCFFITLAALAQAVSPGLSPRRRGSGSITAQSMRDRRWTKWQWDTFLSEYFSFPPSLSFHQCFVFIFICMLPLPEGQTGQLEDLPKKKCCLGNRGALNIKIFSFFRSCHGSGGYSPTSKGRGPSSSPDHSMWDLLRLSVTDVFLRLLRRYPLSVIPPMLYTHHHLSTTLMRKITRESWEPAEK